MDSTSYARFERPGHALGGDRSRGKGWMRPETRVGYDHAHAVVDDNSRLAYAELLPDERADTVVAFTERALAFFETRGAGGRARARRDASPSRDQRSQAWQPRTRA
jgi:hypothetical protein